MRNYYITKCYERIHAGCFDIAEPNSMENACHIMNIANDIACYEFPQ